MYNEVKLETGNRYNEYSINQELDCASYTDPCSLNAQHTVIVL